MISKFLVPQLFLGLFLRKMDIGDFRKLAETLPWRLPEFDGQPRIAKDVPKNAPKDQPVAAFTSADGRKVLEIAPLKIQLRMMPGEIVETNGPQKGIRPYDIDQSFAEFLPLATKVHSVFSEHYGATANRIGLLTELFAHLGASSNQRMQRALLAPKNHFGDRLQELNIQALSKPILYGDRVVNRWVRVKPLRSNDQNNSDLAMGVEVDINTLPEDSYDITAANVEEFITEAKKHIQESIPLFHDESFFEG
ncbi:hypothetical protein BH09SUM1_BH09SUM1_33840 [soil metagenome]